MERKGGQAYYVQFKFRYLTKDICRTFETLEEAFAYRLEIAKLLKEWKETGVDKLPRPMKPWNELIKRESARRWDTIDKIIAGEL